MPDSFEKIGYEFNPRAIDYLKKINIGKFYTGNPYQIPVADSSLDLITLRGVIEHLPNFLDIAQFLSNKLKKGGFLSITATPNVDSPCAILYKEKWKLFYPPEHLNYFSIRSLSLLWAKFDLYCIDVSYPYLETPYANLETDSTQWIKDSREYFEKHKVNSESSPPFVGNMLSAVFKKKNL